jgi:hypothetical protein
MPVKILVVALFSYLASSLVASVSENVAISEEPHHRLVLENPYVRIFRKLLFPSMKRRFYIDAIIRT